MSVKPFDGAAHSGPFLDSERLESSRYLYRFWVRIHRWCSLSLHRLQIARAFHARENEAAWWSAVRMAAAEWSCRCPWRYDSGIPVDFIQTSLHTLQTRKGYLPAHLTRRFPFAKVQFTMGSALSRQSSKSRTGVTFNRRLEGCPRKLGDWLC
jgi:hypothetical protein